MFQVARLKLTLLYLVISVAISTTFSTGMYSILTREIEWFDKNRDIELNERYEVPHDFDPDIALINESKTRIRNNLILINLFIFLASGAIGYLLAGETLRPIKEMLEQQNQFITDASHELKTPLTSLKTSMEVFLRDESPSMNDAKDLIKDSISDIDNLSYLTSSLLQLSRYENITVALKFTNISLKDILVNSIKRVNILAKNKKIQINKEISDINFYGNYQSLEELFTIILDNAIKYSSEGRVVTVKTETLGEYIHVYIADDGIGIEDKYISHIFDRFYRADSFSSGFGIGLSIAKKIINLHHGKINVKSKLGSGTTFEIILPRQK